MRALHRTITDESLRALTTSQIVDLAPTGWQVLVSWVATLLLLLGVASAVALLHEKQQPDECAPAEPR